MKVDLYEKISQEAHKRMMEYLDMDKKANHLVQIMRKEDYLSYWIAVVAWEKGYSLGLNNE